MHRVGFITFSVDSRNGLGRLSREVILRLAARGHETRVLTYHKDEVDAEIAEAPGVDVRRVLPSHYDLGKLLCNLRWGRRVAKELSGCTLLHSLFDFPHTELAARAARRLDVPFVASVNGTYAIAPLYRRRTAGRMAVALLEAYAVISNSAYTLREIEKCLPLPNAVVVPLGVDAAGFTAGVPQRPKAEDRFLVLGVGAIKDRKGWDLLIRAAALLRELQPPVFVTIAGGLEVGDASARYRALAEELGVADRVHFPGLVTEAELKNLYASSHVFALAARSDQHKVEGFGLVYLEAGAFGLPQIGCWDSGAEEPIHDGETGLLVPQNDPAALAEAIARLHGDRALLEKFGRAARARAEAMSWEATVDGIVAAYPSRGTTTRRRSTTSRLRSGERR